LKALPFDDGLSNCLDVYFPPPLCLCVFYPYSAYLGVKLALTTDFENKCASSMINNGYLKLLFDINS
jgi:hypothetical protein